MKINRKYQSLVMGFCMAIGMSFFMSFVMTFVNVGIYKFSLGGWMKSWGIGFLVALPVSLILPIILSKLIERIMQEE